MTSCRWPMLLAIAALFSAGCGSGRVKTSAETVRLREEQIYLLSQIDDLKRRNKELEIELQKAVQQTGSGNAATESATPRIVEIQIDRRSFLRDSDGDGRADQLICYVKSFDGLGRFDQMVGTLSVTALLLPVDGEPVVIGRQTFEPGEVRDAYRYSFMGVHYTFMMPLELPASDRLSATEKDILVRVLFFDGRTGQTLNAEHRVLLQTNR